ncbi:DUF222 domain-containing protein [Microbacterium sp. M3]|uniref:DUF222 domain-containing protein n=1 Tax=Microbacterium arthrosphaerae TaxID=792652 RepID=A0ABU4GYM6_9MICO|nr:MULTISPECIES: DUF222 domain-containing protein [Microbacterium]MDW4572115.1 DUF222 domain-containing protein [Microbacterium arthrosphaerae]MDW7605970.1 DUF222 domain-containing protein [Microbacterium sp. M3]
MTDNGPLVEGEPALLILEAIDTVIANSEEQDGMLRFEGLIGGDSGAALIHALGRVTAELAADDMRSFLRGGARNKRTEEQRSGDALILLMERISAALDCELASRSALRT